MADAGDKNGVGRNTQFARRGICKVFDFFNALFQFVEDGQTVL